MTNRISRQLGQLDRFPASGWLKSMALRRTVPFLGTAGISFVSAEPGRVSLRLADARRVHNHIRGVHAAAAALLAEATSGLAMFYHLPDDRLSLLVRMEIDYLTRMNGGLVAVTTVDDATRVRLLAEERGEATLQVEVTDDAGSSPLRAAMTWAWRPKKGSAKPVPS